MNEPLLNLTAESPPLPREQYETHFPAVLTAMWPSELWRMADCGVALTKSRNAYDGDDAHSGLHEPKPINERAARLYLPWLFREPEAA